MSVILKKTGKKLNKQIRYEVKMRVVIAKEYEVS